MSGMLGQSIVLCNIRRVFERIKNLYGMQATFRKMFVIGGHGQHGGMEAAIWGNNGRSERSGEPGGRLGVRQISYIEDPDGES